jgi:tagaturonate epimerase
MTDIDTIGSWLATQGPGAMVFPRSVAKLPDACLALARVGARYLLVAWSPRDAIPLVLNARRQRAGELTVLACPADGEAAASLRAILPFTAPSRLGAGGASFGVGDRLGLAGPAALELLSHYLVAPVAAQQSVRELSLMGRTYPEVIDAATWAAFRQGYRLPWGADGDHLKDEKWVRTAVQSGCTMVTADVSEHLASRHLSAGDAEVTAAYEGLDGGYRARIEAAYLGKSVSLDCGRRISFSMQDLRRLALVYARGIDHAVRLSEAATAETSGKEIDFELSIDETTVPTTPQAHLFVACECARKGVKITSLAPRFIGEFQKAIDYLGDVKEFREALEAHASIARLGGYRISIHSGSDKYSIFPSVGELTRGSFHLKTSGTQWLEAVRLMASAAPSFFRAWYPRALAAFPLAQASYHVTPDLSTIPPLEEMPDSALAGLLDHPAARQVLHITYGEVLKDPSMRGDALALFQESEDSYLHLVAQNLEKHVRALGIPARKVGE